MECEKQELISLLGDLESRLKKKRSDLYKTRVKLSSARMRLRKMKDTLIHQRKRIVELYKENVKTE